jgi:choline dehydrogenase-like flavoprotein
MLLDGSVLEPGTNWDCDLCIVGSGMGGSALAQKLVSAGRDLLIVEAGNLNIASHANEPIVSEQTGHPFGIPVTRSIELGGTSNRWHGICGPLDEMDFEDRPWIPDSGWPISRAELMPFYEEARKTLGIRGTSLQAASVAGTAVAKHVFDLNFDHSVLNTKIVEYRKPPQRWKQLLSDLARERKIRCLLNTSALELVMDGDGSHVASLVAGAARGTVTIRAKAFIVCAGALETPRLMLNSRRHFQTGIGNTKDLVGRYLLDHPMGHFCKLRFHRPTKAPLYAGLKDGGVHLIAGLMLTPEQQRRHRVPNHYAWIRPSVTPMRADDELLLSFLAVRGPRDLTLRQVRAILTNGDILYRVAVHHFGMRPKYRYGDMFFMTEQLPNRESRVNIAERKRDRFGYPVSFLDWRLTPGDYAGFQAFAKLLFGSGLRSNQYELARIDPDSVWERTVTSAAHHLGTARMADHNSHGVVDPNLRVFGVPNLFVCDGSVFPTVGSVNPSLTIVALAVRLAGHLQSRF